MTVELMKKWVRSIWKPHAMEFSRSLLIMDRFRVHLDSTILELLKDMNTDVLFIPAGLTHRLQPLDIYCNKPMKDQLRNIWEKYVSDFDLTNSQQSKIQNFVFPL